MKLLAKRSLAMIMIILFIGVLGLLARHFGSMEWLVENETRMREFVNDHPWQAWVLGLGIYTTFSLIPGTAGKSVICGWLFGLWPAVLMVDIGLTVAAFVAFVGVRFVFRDIVERRFGRVIRRMNAALEKEGAFYLLTLRLAHVPFTLVNYGSATTSIKTSTFVWTTSLGLLPNTIIFSFVGSRIPTLQELSEKGVHQLLDPLLCAILAATVVLPFSIRWVVNRFRERYRGGRIDLDPLETQI
jgi:uncharacterized membrane protein YdjX (TVP38/TMEM64 family)